ncbi:unnamed protein product, partial [Staurois parvus]
PLGNGRSTPKGVATPRLRTAALYCKALSNLLAHYKSCIIIWYYSNLLTVLQILSFLSHSWGVPLVITVTAVCLQKIGYDASYVSVGWCWISIDAEDKLTWMLLAGKVWEILAYLVLPILYIRIKKHIGRAHEALSEYRPILSTAPVQPRTIADKKLIFIPVIFIFLRIWSTIRFILTLCESPAVHNPILLVLHGIGNSFQGGANCIMFVLCTRVIRTRLLKSLCWCCYGSSSPGDIRESAVSEGYPSGYGTTSGFLDSQNWSPHQPST